MHFGHFGKHSTMNGTTTSISGGRTQGTVDFMPFRLTTMGITSNRRRSFLSHNRRRHLLARPSRKLRPFLRRVAGRATLQSPAADSIASDTCKLKATFLMP